MQMDFSHWMALESAMQGQQPRRAFSGVTLRRIWAFAQPHRRALAAFLLFSIVSALLAVATPVLAGQVVDEIVDGKNEARVIGLAVLIAAIALVDAVVGVAERWQSARIGEASSSTCGGPSSATCSACRSPSSPEPAPAPWSAG
jgi:ABC-type bacteriocin/lantibiotic exporter with double-glycine peptidase domain